MNKQDIVFVVWWDNMELYEEHCNAIKAVCSTYENAVTFIESNGYVKEDTERDSVDGAWLILRDVWGRDNDGEEWYWADPIMYIRMFYLDGIELDPCEYREVIGVSS